MKEKIQKYLEEIVVSVGSVKTEYEIVKLEDESLEQFMVENYYPKYFYPTIHLFQIPKNTPQEIEDELLIGFSLFWSNPSLCGNSIRKAIERIIDEIELPSGNTNSLHTRIVNLNNEYSDVKELLLASKCIGNDGSHVSELAHYDVILAFEFIYTCLVELYEDEKKDLNSIAQKININKKPISKIEQK